MLLLKMLEESVSEICVRSMACWYPPHGVSSIMDLVTLFLDQEVLHPGWTTLLLITDVSLGFSKPTLIWKWICSMETDHHPLVLDMALQFTKGRHVGFAKRPLYDRHFAKEHKGLPGCDLLSHMPIQEWHLDVNEHWSHLRDFMQQEAARWFPKAKRQRRQLYVNEDTWGLVCTRKDLRQQQRQLQRDFERALL